MFRDFSRSREYIAMFRDFLMSGDFSAYGAFQRYADISQLVQEVSFCKASARAMLRLPGNSGCRVVTSRVVGLRVATSRVVGKSQVGFKSDININC